MYDLDKAILLELKARLRETVPLAELILFGSRARGDSEPDSDMDLLVILEDTATDRDRETVSDCAWEAGFRRGIVVVPIVFTKREWEQGPERKSLLALSIGAEGIHL